MLLAVIVGVYCYRYYKPTTSVVLSNKPKTDKTAREHDRKLTENPSWIDTDSIIIDIPKIKSETYVPTYHQNLGAPSIPTLCKEKSMPLHRKSFPELSSDIENNMLNIRYNTKLVLDALVDIDEKSPDLPQVGSN